MVEIQVLPPQKVKTQVSVRHVVKTLGEHFQAFLNANNMQGFVQDEERILGEDTIADRLLRVACGDGMTVEQFRIEADILKEIGGTSFTKKMIRDILAKCMGYEDYIDLKNRSIKLHGNSRKGAWCPVKWEKVADTVNPIFNTERDDTMSVAIYTRIEYKKFLDSLSDPWDSEMNTVNGYMRKVAHYPTQTRLTVKKIARDIRSISNNKYTLGMSYTLIALAMGYRTWTLAKNSSAGDEPIKNRRFNNPHVELLTKDE